jgi:hypothetical protein
MAHLHLTPVPLTVLTALVGGCGRSDESGATHTAMADSAKDAAPVELRVSNVMIGKRIGAGNHITEPTFQFAPQETVYVSVGTSGSKGADHLTAAWRFQTGEILQQSSEPIPKAGENAAFRMSKPKGFKVGTYKVVVFLGDDSVDAKVFVVKK